MDLRQERLTLLLRALFAGASLALFYFWISLLFSLYTATYARVLLTVLWGLFFGLIGFYLLKKEISLSNNFWQLLGILFCNSLFGFAVLLLVLGYPDLFNAAVFQMNGSVLWFFLPIALIAFFFAFQVQQKYALPEWLLHPVHFLEEHFFGIVLAGIFFVSYFLLAIVFNRTEIRIIDSLFEADNTYWLYFLGMDNVAQVPQIRAVHPLAYIILRPLTWLVSLFLNGNPYYAIMIVIAAAGALSVFLVWLFLRENGQGQVFSLIMASMLGATTTHLVFGAFAESYIFSAAAILFFFVVLQRKNSALKSLVPAGLLVFGITISNIVQTLTALFFVRKKIRLILRYLLILLLLAVLFSIVNNAIYPYDSGYFFIPSNLLKEQKYTQSVFDFPAWKLHGRIYATVRNLFFYTVVAPNFFFTLPDPGKPLPRISFFSFSPGQFSHSSFDGFGNLILFTWLALLGFAGLCFLWSLRKREHWSEAKTLFSLALLANIVFNLLFHIIYGEDPFLYSADWAYALILFVALSLEELARHWWSKAILVLFVVMMMVNNIAFLERLMDVLAKAI